MARHLVSLIHRYSFPSRQFLSFNQTSVFSIKFLLKKIHQCFFYNRFTRDFFLKKKFPNDPSHFLTVSDFIFFSFYLNTSTSESTIEKKMVTMLHNRCCVFFFFFSNTIFRLIYTLLTHVRKKENDDRHASVTIIANKQKKACSRN